MRIALVTETFPPEVNGVAMTLRQIELGGVDLLDGFAADAMASGGRGQVLCPWPNRIDGGRYTFAGQTHQLPLTEIDRRNANHGLVRWQPFRIVEHQPSAVTLALRLSTAQAQATASDLATQLLPGWQALAALALRYPELTSVVGDLLVRQPIPPAMTRHALPLFERALAVLRQTGDELVQIGQVGGLGKGEEIQGVRFIGGVGYVVTFRQTDPLFVLDLSDPAHIVVQGEVEIPGFSTYMHPLDADHLLTIGRDIDPVSGQDLGMALQIFDVSNPAAPTRTHLAYRPGVPLGHEVYRGGVPLR